MRKRSFLNFSALFFYTSDRIIEIKKVKRKMNGKRTPESTVKRLGAAILRSDGMKKERGFLQHGNVSVYEHSLGVALACVKLARLLRIKVDERSLVRGALLHDYFLYDWHKKDDGHRWHGFRHGKTAARNAKRDYRLNRLEEYIIARHMFPLTVLPPKSKEGWMVCLADKWCAAEETVRPFFRIFRKRGNPHK